MVINIRTACGYLPDELAEKLNMLEYPAVLLDKDLKVTAKNGEAFGFVPFLRRGTKITRFLPEGDEAKVKEMITCDTLISSINKDGKSFRVNIICGFDCYLVILRPESASLRAEVFSKYEKMSGYEADITEPETFTDRKQGKSSGIADLIEPALYKHLSPHPLPFFNSSAILNAFLSELERAFPNYRSRIKSSISEEELISEGDEKDFILIIAFMISLCLDFSESQVSLEAEKDQNELVFRVSANADESVYDVARLVSLSKGFANSADGFNESDLRAYMLKLLADGNLWDFSIGYNGGRLDFTLRTPYVKRGEEFMVRDISAAFVVKVIKALISL